MKGDFPCVLFLSQVFIPVSCPPNLKDLGWTHPPVPGIRLGGDGSEVMDGFAAASQTSAAIMWDNSGLDP